MRILTLLFGLLLTLPAFSQFPDEMLIPCEEANSEAVTEVPQEIERLVYVECTVYGHVLTPSIGSIWTPPGSFSPIFIPTQMVQAAPEIVNHSFFFKSISSRTLSQEEAQAAYAGFLEGFDEREPSAPETTEIIAVNQLNLVQKVYIFSFTDESRWGYTCQTTCKPEMPFLIVEM